MTTPAQFPAVDTSRPVMVTGATGYVAGWIVHDLLMAGCTVHAAVREPRNAEKLRHLNAIADRAPGSIRYFKGDLLKPGSYAAAMEGCGTVFHTASPFRTQVKDPQRDLIAPALDGTRNVLDQVDRTDSVSRVVLTSSCAAIYTDAAECAKAPGGRLTEAIWNTSASLDYQPYSFSKTVAEREAWDIAGRQDRWDLVVINPSLVLGPAIGGKPGSESFTFMTRLGDGTFRQGVPRFGMGLVDVRDVARAHLAAAFLPGATGRHIVTGPGTSINAVVDALRPVYGDRYPLPARLVPRWLLWLTAPMVGLDRRWVAGNAGHDWQADTTKAETELGMTWRPLEDTARDMFAYMIDQGYFPRA